MSQRATATHPAALDYTYAGSDLALTAITDPVSGRSIDLSYGGGSCPSTSHAPTGMLCEISYWDGTETTFTYNSTGELAQFTNPGTEIADFAYTATGRVDAIRDPLANDAISAGVESDCPATGTTKDCETEIAYTTTGKVHTVTQPEPTSGADRPERTYHYTATDRTASVDIAGFSGTAESVVYDTQGRITTATTAAGLTTETFWNDVTEPVATITGKGEETASVYNINGQVTDAYGPAPSACFTATSHLPVATPVGTDGCGVTVPHTQTTYDQGITGLAASYFTNLTMAGAPSAHGTLATTGPSWTSSPVGTDDWSARYTGTIHLPAGGNWNVFAATTTATVTVYLDGQWVLSNTGEGGTGVFTAPSAGTYPIEIDYQNTTHGSTGGFYVYCARQIIGTTTPFIAGPTPTWLDPGYGLKTSTTTADGDVTDYAYTDPTDGIGPQDGLVTATTEDPGGLNLTTTTDYEDPNTTGTYLRKTDTVLPDGGTTRDYYYAGTEGPLAAVCGVSATTPQGGQLSQQTGPTPGTITKRRVEQFVYNAAGQQAGVRVGDNGDAGSASWQCTHYDTQGRITAQSWPALGTSSAETVTTTYAVGGNPLVTSVETGSTATTKVTTTVDLEGRVVDYTSAGKTTTTTYDQAGQVTTTTGPGGDVHDAYNTAGQLTKVSLGTTTLATATYCTAAGGSCAGEVESVAFDGGVTAHDTYDTDGQESKIAYEHTSTDTVFAGDEATYSLGDRELTDSTVLAGQTTFTNPRSTGGADFAYDGAGRLTQAYVPGETIDYSYATSTADLSCPTPTAGENTNLTSVVTYPSTGGTATTSYCYNGADQLTKAVTSGTAATAGSTTTTTFAFDPAGYQTENKGATYTWTANGLLASATTGGTKTTYTYDAVDRLVKRTKGSTTTRYAYCGFTTAPCAVLNSSGTVEDRLVDTPGGALYAVAPSSSDGTFSFPDLAGNFITTKKVTGSPTTPVAYTPFGTSTTTAPKGGLSGGLNEDAFGADDKLTDATLTTPIVFMGARAYSPAEGRFLSVDPIEGGCANAYVYVRGNPLDQQDLDGQGGCTPTYTFTGSFPVMLSTTTTGNAEICGMSASVRQGKSRTIYTITTSSVEGTANQCWKNLTGIETPAYGQRATDGTAGPGFYQYRTSRKSGPSIDLDTTKHPTTVIHFNYVKPELCGVVQYA